MLAPIQCTGTIQRGWAVGASLMGASLAGPAESDSRPKVEGESTAVNLKLPVYVPADEPPGGDGMASRHRCTGEYQPGLEA